MENLISKKKRYSYILKSGFEVGFEGTEVSFENFHYESTSVTISDFEYECDACENTGLVDPYGAFGLGDGKCPECNISIGTIYHFDNEPTLFNIGCTRECVIKAIFDAHKIFYKEILESQSK